MTDLARAEVVAGARRLMPALAASTFAHAALLAGISVVPGGTGFSLAAPDAPIRARIVAIGDGAAVNSPDPLTPPPAVAPPRQSPAERGESSIPNPAGPARSAGLPGGEVFYRGNDVDVRAEPLNVVEVRYPESALAAGVRGMVRLRLLIDREGRLRDASVTEARPAGMFENAALEAVMALKFRPAIRQGVPVGSIKLIEVPFEPDCDRTGSCLRE